MSVLGPIVLAGAVTFAVAAALLASCALHGHLTCDWVDGAQKVHGRPTPRVGGVALFAGLCAGAAALPEGKLLWGLLAAALPAVLSGLVEDLTGGLRPAVRLAATLLSGLGVALLGGLVIAATGIPMADWALAVPLVAVAFTAFAVAGATNAVNLIDGFHGLATGTALIILTGLALAARLAGDAELFTMIAMAAAAMMAFLLFNFPRGRIFLGDAGAYFIGMLLAAFAVALPARNAEVAPLVGLVALAYPVTETLVSITRRRMAGGRASEADGGHLHSLVHAVVAEPFARDAGDASLGNPLTSALIWPLPVLCAGLAVAGVMAPGILPMALALVVGVYLAAYTGLVRSAGSASGRTRLALVPVALRRDERVTRPEWARDAA